MLAATTPTSFCQTPCHTPAVCSCLLLWLPPPPHPRRNYKFSSRQQIIWNTANVEVWGHYSGVLLARTHRWRPASDLHRGQRRQRLPWLSAKRHSHEGAAAESRRSWRRRGGSSVGGWCEHAGEGYTSRIHISLLGGTAKQKEKFAYLKQKIYIYTRKWHQESFTYSDV